MIERTFCEANHLASDIEEVDLDERVLLDAEHDQTAARRRGTVDSTKTNAVVIITRCRRWCWGWGWFRARRAAGGRRGRRFGMGS